MSKGSSVKFFLVEEGLFLESVVDEGKFVDVVV